MSASGWPMAGQQSTPIRNNTGNRPPVCFKCGQEGHFVIACPNSGPQILASFPPPAASYQQYTGPAPPPQAFPQQTASYQPNQQFGGPGPQYSYSQPPPHQPYGGPPATAQYGPGYQAPSFNQYRQANLPPQFAGPTYSNPAQQFGPPPPIKPPYPVQNGNFAGNLASAPSTQQFPKPWNNAPPVPASRAPTPYQRQQRNYSDPGFNSGTPGFQNQSHQASRERTGSQSYQQTPNTPASNVGSAQYPTPMPLQSSPVIAHNPSKVSSTSSTPYARLGALDNDVIKEIKPKPLEGLEDQKPIVKEEEGQKEDGEVPEGDEEEESEEDDENAILNWEYMAIFLAPSRLETVALAQPLSTNFGMTPVPLLDPNSKNSVSRYARKDNLKEFIRPITMAPQWSYIKDDPAFAELGLDCQLIPLSDVPAWITTRHSSIVVDDPSQPSRKRSRSTSSEQGPQEEDEKEQEDGDLEMVAPEETAETHSQGPPSKRIKNELAEAEKLAAPTTVHVTSPINIGRAGTPCLTTEDDAWAPDPGEVAAKPMSPTEMLLASLGVTGTPKPPKPAKQASLPPPVEDAQQTPQNTNAGPSPNSAANLPAGQTPTPNLQGSQPPSNANLGGSQPQSAFAGPPSNPPFANNQNRQPQYGLPTNQPYTNGPQSQPQFAPPNNYQNGVPANTGFGNPQYPNPQYGQPLPQSNGGSLYGPPVPQQNGNQQYRPPMNSGFGNGHPANGQYGVGPQGPSQYNHEPQQNASFNGQQYNQAPYNGGPAGTYGQQGNPQFANGSLAQQQYVPPQVNPQFGPGPPAQQSYAPPPQTNPQFGSGPPQQYGTHQTNPQFGNGFSNPQQYGGVPQGNPPFNNGPLAQQQYGAAPQNNPPFSNGPPLQQHFSGPPQSNPQFSNGQPGQHQYGPTPQGNVQFPNLQQQQQQYTAPQGNSQYGNGPSAQHTQSYNSAPQNDVHRQDSGYASAHGSYNNGPGPNGFNNENGPQSRNQQLPPDSSNQHQQGPTTPQLQIEIPSTTSPQDNDSDNESLSPTSLEILGKLLPDRKVSSGRKAESKLKRPAPVVEAAYSRRW